MRRRGAGRRGRKWCAGYSGARLQLAAQQITELETLVVRNGPIPGEASFQPATLLSTPQPTWEEAVREWERSTRQQLYAAAEAYCLGFNSSGTDHYQPRALRPRLQPLGKRREDHQR